MPGSNGHLLTLPLWARSLNAIGGSLEKTGWRPVNLTPESICAAARKNTGLSDFGGPAFCQKVTGDLQAVQAETASDLSLLGDFSLRIELIRHAEIRLRTTHFHKQFPEIGQMRWKRPIFITGLPRTGTTFLHNLLCQDPEVRVPYLWELYMPAPLSLDDQSSSDPRIKLAHARFRQARPLTKKYDHMHPLDPMAPEECFFMLLTPNVLSRAFLYAYVDKIHAEGVALDYQWYFEQLQVMQWYNGNGRYVSKTPFHLLGLQELTDLFPDAAIIQTHRRLDEAVPSFSSLMSVNHLLHEKRLDQKKVAEYWLYVWSRTVERATAVRRQLNSSQFYDLDYTSLTADPMAVVQAIYQHFGYNLTAEAEGKMQRWLAESKKKRPATPHQYTLGQFGLTRQQIKDSFPTYIEQFKSSVWQD